MLKFSGHARLLKHLIFNLKYMIILKGVNTAGGAIGADVLVIIGNYAFDSFPGKFLFSDA